MMLQDSKLVIGVSVVQAQKRLEHTTKTDHLTNFADGGRESHVFRVVNRWQHNSFLIFKTSGIPMQLMRLDSSKKQNTGLLLSRRFSCAGVHFKDIPAESIARIVGSDRTVLCD